MALYFGMAFLLFMLAIYNSSVERKTNVGTFAIGKVSLYLFILISIMLGGFRWQTGTDWEPYYNYFNSGNTWEQFNNNTFEIAYSFLNFLIKEYFNSYTILLFFLSFFVIILRYKTIMNIALYPALSYYLFFCDNIGGMFPVRQALAVSIALTSIYFIHRKNKIAFLLITILASSFHLSLLLWFISYPLYHKKISHYMIIILFIGFSIIGMFGSKLIISIVEILLVKNGVSGRIAEKIIFYASGDYSSGVFSLTKMLLSFIKRMVFLSVFLALRSKINLKYKYANGLINIYSISLVVYSLFAFNDIFTPLGRMVTVFLFIEVLVLPVILSLFKYSYAKYVFLLILFLYGLMKLNSNITTYPDAFIPYRSIFM